MSPKPRKEDTILLADDEPYNLRWLIEFLENQKFKVVTASNVDSAIALLQDSRFRAVITDLSIPLLDQQLRGGEPLAEKYPGLRIAEFARNDGHTGRQVIVYSVHDDIAVRQVADRLGCTYLMKGRPRQFKDELRDVLAFDPLSSTPAGVT